MKHSLNRVPWSPTSTKAFLSHLKDELYTAITPLGNLHQPANKRTVCLMDYFAAGATLRVLVRVGEVGAAICALSILWSLLQGEHAKYMRQMISRRKD